jgi:hypothetical protein
LPNTNESATVTRVEKISNLNKASVTFGEILEVGIATDLLATNKPGHKTRYPNHEPEIPRSEPEISET